ncbi:restriction endonuclease subunit S [Marinobacter lipolyticus]|uniref:restriction endonuclease subunit S n=1 Tax=Marinobacter lipolyticus TaxID=209639 RepID=UPI001BCE3F8F|nr:restriction endonuclease subunit S [Marinobacter lipolyticus]
MSNTVPEGWAIQPLDGKVEILSGYPFKSSLFCDDPSKMGVIRIRDLVKQSVETFYAGDFDDEYVVRRGDILIGMDGDFNIVKWKTKSALLNQRICKVKASKDGGFDSDFLFYSLVDDLDSIHAATGATTVKHLSVKDIKGIEKAYPPLPEQQKIATILSSVDDVIGKTRAQIDKLKDLKTGMMQELLTKGIGHTEFKDSPVGKIPAAWNTFSAQELLNKKILLRLQDGNHGSQYPRSSEFVKHGVPYIASL